MPTFLAHLHLRFFLDVAHKKKQASKQASKQAKQSKEAKHLSAV